MKVLDIETILRPNISADFCVLPPELDYSGTITYLEDCKALKRWGHGLVFRLNTWLQIQAGSPPFWHNTEAGSSSNGLLPKVS